MSTVSIKTAVLLAVSIHLTVAQSYSVSTIAGTTTIHDGIPATQAFLRWPQATQIDLKGNIYVLDRFDARVRRVDSKGVITTVAGNGFAGFSGDGGPAVNAQLNNPVDIVLDRQGLNLYIADQGNNRVRRVDLTSGTITTLAGNGSSSFAGTGGPATQVGFHTDGLAVDGSGNVYVGDSTRFVVWKVDVAAGTISIFAGSSGTRGNGGDGGLATSAAFTEVRSIATDRQFLYVLDTGAIEFLRRVDLTTDVITPAAARSASYLYPVYVSADNAGDLLLVNSGALSYVAAGSSTFTPIAGGRSVGYAGDGDGSLDNVQFNNAHGVAFAGPSDYLIADAGNSRLRRIKNNAIQTIAGFAAPDGQPATSSIFNHPLSAVTNSVGDLFVADNQNHRIRKAAAGTGIMSTVFGKPWTDLALAGANNFPVGLALGPNDAVYVTGAGFVSRLDPAGPKAVAGGGSDVYFHQEGVPATTAWVDDPHGIRVDAQGNIYFADTGAYRVRKIDAATGLISTVAGNDKAGSFAGENVPATSVGIVPTDVALDAAGNLYIADTGLWRIRRVTAGTGLITTVAGGGHGNGGDGGSALKAGFLNPTGVTVDAAGNIFVADTEDLTIRRIDGRTGIITRVAGTGDFAHPQESGAALATSIGATSVLALPDGSLLVTDSANDRIRKLTLQTPRALSIGSSNPPTGVTGATVAVGVKVTDAAGFPVAYVPVTFTVASGAAQIADATVSTAADGTSTVQVTLGLTPGPVSIRASVSGVNAVTFTINVVPPFINSTNGVTGLPMSNPPVTALSQNGLMQISGQGFMAGVAGGTVGDADLVNGALPAVFNGVCVDVSGTRAPILAVTPTQVIFQVPALPDGGTADVSVIAACGSGQDVQTAAVTLPSQATAPEFFYATRNADGSANVAVMDNATSLPASSSQPGDSVTVYLTGLGTTDSASPGTVVSANAVVNANVTLQLGTETITPDWVTTPTSFPGAPYITTISENAGVYMIQFTIPSDAPSGNLPLTVMTGDGSTSPASAYLLIR